MDLNKIVKNNKKIPFDYKNSLLVNFFIDDNFSNKPNIDKKIVIRLLISILPNNKDIFKKEFPNNIEQNNEFALIDIISKDYEDLIVDYESSINSLYSVISNLSFDLKSRKFKIEFHSKQRKTFSLSFICNDIKYFFIDFVDKNDINETNIKEKIIFYPKNEQ